MIPTKPLLLVLTASFHLSFASSAFAQQPYDYVRWGIGLCTMKGSGTKWFSMIFMLVFWVLVIVGLAVLIIRQVQATKNEKDG